MQKNNEIVQLLIQYLPFWDQLTVTQQNKLCTGSSINQYKKRSNIHGGDETCRGLMIVLSGTLRSYLIAENGRELTLTRFEKGEICVFAASCVIASMGLNVVIDAEKVADILIISGNAYSDIAKENTEARDYIFNIAVRSLSSAVLAMQQTIAVSLDKRIAIFLCEEMAKTNSTTIYLTHEQLAGYISSAREAVTRVLKKFSREGIVELLRGGIKVLCKDRLQQIADSG